MTSRRLNKTPIIFILQPSPKIKSMSLAISAILKKILLEFSIFLIKICSPKWLRQFQSKFYYSQTKGWLWLQEAMNISQWSIFGTLKMALSCTASDHLLNQSWAYSSSPNLRSFWWGSKISVFIFMIWRVRRSLETCMAIMGPFLAFLFFQKTKNKFYLLQVIAQWDCGNSRILAVLGNGALCAVLSEDRRL